MENPGVLLSKTMHRPFPLPEGPWIAQQSWDDLLFAHWRMPFEQIRPLVPEQLQLETLQGSAWVSLTPFRLRMCLRGLSLLKLRCPELNCRTYVRYNGVPGIYFFSLDAGSRLAVMGARMLYRLPYFHARMRTERSDAGLRYTSERKDGRAWFRAEYAPIAPPFRAQVGSWTYWLAERYCLYTVSVGRVWRADIHHGPWDLQEAHAEISENTVAQAAGISLPGAPDVLHFSARQDVLVWPLKPA